ncbi:MAG: exodeoxyribonuclease VII large subunit, partial [Bacteroidales bacterium]|nr:exodeoxyribonuclease VII large subunit [Bacteroidales bacterium]
MNSQLSLYELNQLISNTLKTQLSGFYWVVAEINNINESRQGHCYLELIEKDKDTDNIKASIRGSIWASKYRFIKPYFENITGKSLETSMKILLKVSVEFHPMYGLSLIVNDIDANYTLGDLHRKRQEVINLLVSQGVIDMNKMLEIPEVIQNIAVISSQGAAGYGDFVEQLSSNPYSYKYKIALYNAIMQGVKTEKSIIEALNHIYHEKFKPDVVVIIRGGGAKTDLVAFDSYDIAYHITQFPIPIFTGIGHERDESIADMVSHSRFKTPTAVAAHINEHNRSFENEITEIYDSIVEHTKIHIKNHFSMINYFAIEMVNNSREKIAEAIYATDKYLV